MVGSARVQQAAGPVTEHYLSIIQNLGSKTCSYESWRVLGFKRGKHAAVGLARGKDRDCTNRYVTEFASADPTDQD